jgi:hypothetical protein
VIVCTLTLFCRVFRFSLRCNAEQMRAFERCAASSADVLNASPYGLACVCAGPALRVNSPPSQLRSAASTPTGMQAEAAVKTHKKETKETRETMLVTASCCTVGVRGGDRSVKRKITIVCGFG